MTTLRAQAARNLKIWAIVATVAWGGSTILYGCQRFLDPHDDFTDGGVTGPLEVQAVGVSNNDVVIYKAVRTLDRIEPGQTVGWASSFCVEPGKYLLARSDIYRMRDGARITAGRERLWTPQDHRCGTSIGGLEMPIDAEAGIYEIRRTATTNPLGWFKQQVVLKSVRFAVTAATIP